MTDQNDDVGDLIEEAESDEEDTFEHEQFDEKWTLSDRIDSLSRRQVLGLGGGALLAGVGAYTIVADDGYNPDGVDDRGHIREFNLDANEWTSFNVDHGGGVLSMVVAVEIPDGSATVFVMTRSEYERHYPNGVDAHSMTIQESTQWQQDSFRVTDSGDWTIVIDNTGRGDPPGMNPDLSVSGKIEYRFR